MRRTLLALAMLLALALTLAGPTHATDLPVTDPNADQCHDGVDNDGDGKADYSGVWDTPSLTWINDPDPGCTDNTPRSERFTAKTPTLYPSAARELAGDALDTLFRDKWEYRANTEKTCRRATRTKFRCGIVWSYFFAIYGARISVAYFTDVEHKRSGDREHVRAWRFSLNCANSANPFRCASRKYKRYYEDFDDRSPQIDDVDE
jgi:hypothetical protein